MEELTVGSDADGRPVFSGEYVFRLMDEQGVPLPVTCEALRGRGGFDVAGFVAAARASGNYSDEKIRRTLLNPLCFDGIPPTEAVEALLKK